MIREAKVERARNGRFYVSDLKEVMRIRNFNWVIMAQALDFSYSKMKKVLSLADSTVIDIVPENWGWLQFYLWMVVDKADSQDIQNYLKYQERLDSVFISRTKKSA